ncbi:hypothetical protein [Aliarcobacter butzleri]|uniref:hypothetical protein n=1 Tax=Aliarcobacter butzleri TaxID=28197 RepID=UPI0021B3964E|nr:hypothetical protein [Aliarcobacter butzleri]MCT7596123.1 hypothetical protein [Aliarcobacter butzleri]
MNYLEVIAEKLESGEEVSFGFSDKYLTVDIRAEGGFEVNIYDCKTDFINEKEPIDGGIYEGDNALDALNFFLEDLL